MVVIVTWLLCWFDITMLIRLIQVSRSLFNAMIRIVKSNMVKISDLVGAVIVARIFVVVAVVLAVVAVVVVVEVVVVVVVSSNR